MNLETETLARMAWDQVWQVTVLILLVAGITKCLGKRRPHLAYVLWMLVILKCLTPPLWSSPTGIFSWVQRIGRAPVAVDSAAPAVVDSPNPGATDAGENAANPGWQEFGAEGSESANEPIERRIGIAGGLLCLWLVGVVAIALIALVRTVRCMTNLRRWQCDPDDALMTALGELKARLGLRRQVRLIVSSQPLGPAVFGVRQPTIVLPESLVAGRSTNAIKPILAHELVHVRRGDTLFALVQLCAGILWWFHPLVWWAGRRMEAEREQLCDEETIAGLKLNQGSYAQSLLDVLKSRRQVRPLLVAPGVRALAVTTERLEHIMSLPETIHRRTPWAYWLMLAIGAAVLLPGRGPTATAGADDKQGSAATETVKSSAAKDQLPTGSGLISQLPKDGIRARFDMVATGERNGRQMPSMKAEISLSSVGREKVDGVPCRWIEFSVGPNSSAPNGSKPAISKLLIPEERLINGADPLEHIKKGWGRGGGQEKAHAVGPRWGPQDGPGYALFPGKMRAVEALPKKSIKTSLGVLECDGLSGEIEFEERDRDVKITFEIYRNEKAPFGVVAYRMRTIETKDDDGKLLDKMNVTLTLRDVEVNVESELETPKE